jgi:hypothetical protein
MINNVTDMLLNMTNTTNAPNAANSTNYGFAYALMGAAVFWGSLIAARKGYEAVRDGRCNPCGLFRADTTTPHDQRTYLTFSGGEVAGFA